MCWHVLAEALRHNFDLCVNFVSHLFSLTVPLLIEPLVSVGRPVCVFQSNHTAVFGTEPYASRQPALPWDSNHSIGECQFFLWLPDCHQLVSRPMPLREASGWTRQRNQITATVSNVAYDKVALVTGTRSVVNHHQLLSSKQLGHQNRVTIAIKLNLQQNGVKLAFICSLFAIIQPLTEINQLKSQIFCCLAYKN